MNKILKKIIGVAGGIIIAFLPVYFAYFYPLPQTVEGTVRDFDSNLIY